MATLNIRNAPYSAAGNGIADDYPALASAFGAAQPGDTILVPAGTYKIVLPGGYLTLPTGVTLTGVGESSQLNLAHVGATGDYREFMRFESNTVLENLFIRRETDLFGIPFQIFEGSNITLRNLRIDGRRGVIADDWFPFRIGQGPSIVRNLLFDNLIVERNGYGLFMANDADGGVIGFTIRNCTFRNNNATDLEFNGPSGTLQDITVHHNLFEDQQGEASGGFGVGFANVKNGLIENNKFERYKAEPIHIEDRSADIIVRGNTIIGGSTVSDNGIIMVLNNSTRVEITNNYIDARPNPNNVAIVLVVHGGPYEHPSYVTVSRNILIEAEDSPEDTVLMFGEGHSVFDNQSFPWGASNIPPPPTFSFLSSPAPTPPLLLPGFSFAFSLNGRYSRFQSDISAKDAIPSSGETVASVVFRVLADGVEVFQSATLTGSSEPVPVDLNVAGVETLEVVVDS
jgi:hypothetical protein